jgi:hypothetical protein
MKTNVSVASAANVANRRWGMMLAIGGRLGPPVLAAQP